MRRLIFLAIALSTVLVGLPRVALAQSPCEVVVITAPSVESATGCYFEFTGEPADAKVNAKITTVPGDVTGAPVTVTARDAEGATDTAFNGNVTLSINSGPEGASLGGTTTVQAIDGVATFSSFSADTVDVNTTYTLLATTDDPNFSFDPAVSDPPFLIGNAACPPGSACSFTASNTEEDFGKTGTITGAINGNGGTRGGVIVGTYGDQGIDCAGYTEHTQGTLTFTVTSDRLKQVTIIVPKVLVKVDPDNGIAHYQICYSNGGTPALLPKCLLDAAGNPTNVPCVLSKSKTKAGQVKVVFVVPEGDPKGRL
jgi:hypothetical protein